MNSSSSSSDDDGPAIWDKVENVEYEFVKTGMFIILVDIKDCHVIYFSGKSKGAGCLVTHGGLFRFHNNGSNKKETTTWWLCAEFKATGCAARARTVKKTIEEEDGTTREVQVLVEVATAEVIYILLVSDSVYIQKYFISVSCSEACAGLLEGGGRQVGHPHAREGEEESPGVTRYVRSTVQ